MGSHAQSKEPRTGGVAHCLQVSALVQVQDRPDGHALGVIHTPAESLHSGQALAVGAHATTELIGHLRQALFASSHGKQQGQGAQHATGHDHTIRTIAARRKETAPTTNTGLQGDPLARLRLLDRSHASVRLHPHPQFFGQVKVIVRQRVLGPMPTPNHAGPTADAARSRGSFATKIGIRHSHTRLPEPNAHPGGMMLISQPQVRCHRRQSLVRRSRKGNLSGTQHPQGGLIVWGQLTLPVRQPAPGGRFKEGVRGSGQGIGVDQRSTANPDPGQDGHVPKKSQAQDATTTEPGKPKPTAQIPVAAGEVLITKAAALLQHQHRVTLLRQTQGRDRPTKTRTHDDPVVVLAFSLGS